MHLSDYLEKLRKAHNLKMWYTNAFYYEKNYRGDSVTDISSITLYESSLRDDDRPASSANRVPTPSITSWLTLLFTMDDEADSTEIAFLWLVIFGVLVLFGFVVYLLCRQDSCKPCSPMLIIKISCHDIYVCCL